MEKNNKNPAKAEPNTLAEQNAEGQRLELMSKLSGVVLYNLLRDKDKTTISAAQSLNKAINCYSNTYYNIQKLASVANDTSDLKLAVDYIREELGLTPIKNDQYSVCIDENRLFESIKDELAEHSWPIAKVLLEVSRRSYGKMSKEEAKFAAKEITATIQKQSDIQNFSHVVEKVLAATEEVKNNLSDFINEYVSLKDGIKEVSIRSIMQKGIGEGHEPILRAASSIASEHITSEDTPSWPRITIERSISGNDISMAMRFRNSSSYFAIVYLKPYDYDLIARFVVQLKDSITELESHAVSKVAAPKLSIKTYSDIGVCMVGAAHFNPAFEAIVKDKLQMLFGNRQI